MKLSHFRVKINYNFVSHMVRPLRITLLNVWIAHQTVTYHVDDEHSGYVADVSYSGEPHYGPSPADAPHGKGPAHPAPHHPAPHHAAPHHGAPAYHGSAPAPHHAAPAYHGAAPAPHAPVYHALL